MANIEEITETDEHPVTWLRDLNGTGNLHVCHKTDPGAVPVYTRASAKQPGSDGVETTGGFMLTDEQIKYMRDRFLGWKIPVDSFYPDGGVSFKRTFNEHTAHPSKHEPSGTNIFDAQVAEQMIRYMLDGLPLRRQPEGAGDCAHKEQLVKDLRAIHISAFCNGERMSKQDDKDMRYFIYRTCISAANELEESTTSHDTVETAMKWQPIETAPKDGTWVLVKPGWEVTMPYAVSHYSKYIGGWLRDNVGLYDHAPTHWMPLPKPPTPSDAERGEKGEGA